MQTGAVSKPPGKSRKRRRRRIDRHRQPQAEIFTRRVLSPYELLDDRSLVALEQHADWLLENVGMEFRDDPTSLQLFREAGAVVTGERVRFKPGLARDLCRHAPSHFTLHSRNENHTVQLGKNNIVLMPGYGSPFVNDLHRGRRYATLTDFENFAKLTYTTPHLHHSGGTVVEPVDIPVNKRHLDMVRAHLILSDKPFMGAVTSPSRAEDSITMARMVFGPEFLDCKAVMQANININSPFVFDGVMSTVLRIYAAANQCVCVSPAIFGGAMGPVTPAAIAAQTLAESMTGIALAQLVRPGCPVVFGSFHSTMNLRTGSLTFGTPEANLITMALSQLGHRLNVPVRSGGGQITASNALDAQAMSDSTNAMWSTVMSGAHQVWHAAGWLEGGLTMSYEKFIFDLDNCGGMLRLLQGMPVNSETLTCESYREVGPGDNFLSTTHTMNHYATANYESLLPDAGPFERWRDTGKLTDAERANGIWKSMLDQYQRPPLQQSIADELDAFVLSKKAQLPDEWY